MSQAGLPSPTLSAEETQRVPEDSALALPPAGEAGPSAAAAVNNPTEDAPFGADEQSPLLAGTGDDPPNRDGPPRQGDFASRFGGKMALYARIGLIVLLSALLLTLLVVTAITVFTPWPAQQLLDTTKIRLSHVSLENITTESVRIKGLLVVDIPKSEQDFGVLESSQLDLEIDDDGDDDGNGGDGQDGGRCPLWTKVDEKPWPNQVSVGQLSFPDLKFDHGEAIANLDTTLRILNKVGMAKLTSRLLHQAKTLVHLSGKVAVRHHNNEISDLQLNKPVELPGLRGLGDINIDNIDMPRQHHKGGIAMIANATIKNPSDLTVKLPRLDLEVVHENVPIAQISASNATLGQGTNHLSFDGRILAQHHNKTALDAASHFFTEYLTSGFAHAVLRGVLRVPKGKTTIPWLLHGLCSYVAPIIVKNSHRVLPIIGVPNIRLNLDFSYPKHAYNPPSSGEIALHMVSLFGFPTEVYKLGMDADMTVLDTASATSTGGFARFQLPMAAADTKKTKEGLLVTAAVNDIPLSAKHGQQAMFDEFVKQLYMKEELSIGINGTVDVQIHTPIGTVHLEDLPMDINSTYPGMNQFGNHPMVINNLDVVNATKGKLHFNCTATLDNAADFGFQLNQVKLSLGLFKTVVGELDINSANITHGKGLLQATGVLRQTNPVEKLVFTKILSGYITGSGTNIDVTGHSGTTDVPPLQPILNHIQLKGVIPSQSDQLIRSAKINLKDNSTTLNMHNLLNVGIKPDDITATIFYGNTKLCKFDWTNDNGFILPPRSQSHDRIHKTNMAIPGRKTLGNVNSIRVNLELSAVIVVIEGVSVKIEWQGDVNLSVDR